MAKDSNRSSLRVKWVEGAEKDDAELPQVLVDGQPVGVVDRSISVSPGDHRVSVRLRRASTRDFLCTVRPGRSLLLEYESSEASPVFHGLMVVIGLATSLLTSWIFDGRSPETDADTRYNVIVAIGIVVGTAADWLLSPYFFHGTLKIGNSVDPSAGLLRVRLPASPPRPKVLVDGKAAGAVADILRVRPGARRVRVRGWFDHSEEISIHVAAGQLVELGTTRTSTGVMAMAATALPSIVAFSSLVYFNLIDWALPVILGGVVASFAVSVLFSRSAPTMTLDVNYKASPPA